ncbi:ATP-binding protein [Streptomyces sp. NPDC002476]|uniref:ATP-binding protein n=1 Tax=Streptomyces sp. NPDC002476 TaxID=3364648 RepID=UPI0036B88428
MRLRGRYDANRDVSLRTGCSCGCLRLRWGIGPRIMTGTCQCRNRASRHRRRGRRGLPRTPGAGVRSTRPNAPDERARLCVTEMVTNARPHTPTSVIGVEAVVLRTRVTVAVTDEAHWALPKPTDFRVEPERVGGQGLLLVERLALAWGATVLDHCVPYRKAVWFTLGTTL